MVWANTNSYCVLSKCSISSSWSGLALPRVMDMVFTEEDKQRLYDHVRTDDGRVPIEKTTSELCEVLRALEKNS